METVLLSEKDSPQSCPGLDLDDSRALTVASVAGLNDDRCPSRTTGKAKLPSDFGFLLDETPVKVARTGEEVMKSSTKKQPQKVRKTLTPRLLKSPPRVCGPEIIQTLRGRLLDREVSLVICGESHEDVIDLTRQNGILEPERSWAEVPAPPKKSGRSRRPGFNSSEALACKRGLTLEAAKEWAADVLEDTFVYEEDKDGAMLVFEAKLGTDKSVARVFDSETKASLSCPLQVNATLHRWCDKDATAFDFNSRRLRALYSGEWLSIQEQDTLIAERKEARLAEGLELFDDWLLRQCQVRSDDDQSGKSPIQVDLILENQVPPAELEMHVEHGVGPSPPAHDCIKAIELDSESDGDGDNPDDGTGSFADYLLRRAREHLPPGRLHCVDPRNLGNSQDETENASFQALLSEPLPEDPEQHYFDQEALGDDKMVHKKRKILGSKVGDCSCSAPGTGPSPLPSWEAYFGTVAGLLYHTPHVKADFVPLLVKFGLCSTEKLAKFFEALYFGTVPDALSLLGPIDDEARSLTRTRSLLAFRSKRKRGGQLMQRPHDDGLVPVRVAPIGCYLKARGSNPPRTWVSGLAEEVREGGAGALVDAVQSWVQECVLRLLADPKKADATGDYFIAYLRECHREIYDDINRADPAELQKATYLPSEKKPHSKKHRHNLKGVTIPSMHETFQEIMKFDPQLLCASTKKQRILAKFLIDAFQMRLVDMAAILKMAQIVVKSPSRARVVIVFYAGSDHTTNVTRFWQKYGFSSKGLPAKGIVGKTDWEGTESRGLKMPAYLHDFHQLFPVPLA